MDRAKRIRSERLRECQYREEYARSLEGKKVEGDGDDNFEHMWEQVKRAMVESAIEMSGSVRIGVGNPKCMMERCSKGCDYEKGGCLERGIGS